MIIGFIIGYFAGVVTLCLITGGEKSDKKSKMRIMDCACRASNHWGNADGLAGDGDYCKGCCHGGCCFRPAGDGYAGAERYHGGGDTGCG